MKINPLDIKLFKDPKQFRDPVRFPKVAEKIETEVKQSYDLELNKMIVNITKTLSKI